MTRRTLFLLGISGSAGCLRSERRLNVFNWSSYVAPETVPNFEREFGVRVRYSVYESNEEMLARVLSGNSGWDVVFPSNYYVQPMREYGLVAQLDHSRLPNIVHLDAPFRAPEWDPALRWSVPYMWNATGIVASRDAGPPSAWADLWDARWRGRLTMLDDPVDVFGACLKKLGWSVNAESEQQLRRAQAEALSQKPLVRAYLNAEVRDQLVAGDVLAAQLWSTTAQQAIDEAPGRLAFVYPAEGFPIYPDCAVILKESRRVELAHDFVNYLLRPEVAAGVVASVKTATANADARELLPAGVRDNPVLYPPPEVLARGEWARTTSAAVQRLRDRLWTEVKSA